MIHKKPGWMRIWKVCCETQWCWTERTREKPGHHKSCLAGIMDTHKHTQKTLQEEENKYRPNLNRLLPYEYL